MTPDELRSLVATMRELGVTECGEVKLGPPPVARKEPPNADERAKTIKERAMRNEERQRDVMFAASNIKPALRAVK